MNSIDKQTIIEALQTSLAIARENLSGLSARNNSEIYYDYLCACSDLEKALERIRDGQETDC